VLDRVLIRLDGWIDGCIFCLFTSLVLLDVGGWMFCLFTSRLDRNLRLCRCGCCERLGLNWSNVQCVGICLFGLLVGSLLFHIPFTISKPQKFKRGDVIFKRGDDAQGKARIVVQVCSSEELLETD
jgi:hypothetical protein